MLRLICTTRIFTTIHPNNAPWSAIMPVLTLPASVLSGTLHHLTPTVQPSRVSTCRLMTQQPWHTYVCQTRAVNLHRLLLLQLRCHRLRSPSDPQTSQRQVILTHLTLHGLDGAVIGPIGRPITPHPGHGLPNRIARLGVIAPQQAPTTPLLSVHIQQQVAPTPQLLSAHTQQQAVPTPQPRGLHTLQPVVRIPQRLWGLILLPVCQ